MKRGIIGIIVLSSLFTALTACDRNTVYSEFHSVPLREWYVDSVLTYRFDIADTLSTYQVLIYVRHTQQYPYQNMWLFVDWDKKEQGLYMQSDSTDSVLDSVCANIQTTEQDTIEFYLANDRGEWLGNGKNGLTEMPVLYEENYRFSHSGEQVVRIAHGMREEPLRGISDVGIVVKRNE